MKNLEIKSNEIRIVENFEIEKIEVLISYYDEFLEKDKEETRNLLYIRRNQTSQDMVILNYQNNNMFYLSQIFWNDFENSKEYLDIFNKELENNQEIKADYLKLYENLNKSDIELIFDIYAIINLDLDKDNQLNQKHISNFFIKEIEKQAKLTDSIDREILIELIELEHNIIRENHFNDSDLFRLLQFVYHSIISR
jgi:hypothetical protein